MLGNTQKIVVEECLLPQVSSTTPPPPDILIRSRTMIEIYEEAEGRKETNRAESGGVNIKKNPSLHFAPYLVDRTV